jgi:hypothetical protein
MEDALSRMVLVKEIMLLLRSLEDRGTSFEGLPSSEENLQKLSTTDLRALKSDLRDLVRTLGGNRI